MSALTVALVLPRADGPRHGFPQNDKEFQPLPPQRSVSVEVFDSKWRFGNHRIVRRVYRRLLEVEVWAGGGGGEGEISSVFVDIQRQ